VEIEAQSLEKSLKYMAWSIKEMAAHVKRIAELLEGASNKPVGVVQKQNVNQDLYGPTQMELPF
jgi:hypothetical protein